MPRRSDIVRRYEGARPAANENGRDVVLEVAVVASNSHAPDGGEDGRTAR